ncbi:hypothetical protein FNF31_07861 [Cafeteria roenbergensis]|uniref:Protein dpy-30 homolog n=1 Tax=Cafeteria roenbergensis TaxID=33653 RepID=A0A5A8C0G0_CAFRO|nr:hypothetical protein FNF31_07861 [Cafeteria roenbergensis]|mmetsp:Transcript_18839/g.71763  ORF Transcript_18839/g.71763 Transcript_18839/m.71763 type:complete len:105 (-) Transcript_18839:352-666(-)
MSTAADDLAAALGSSREEGEAIEAAVQTETADLDTAVLPVRAYLDRTVVPLLLQGLAQLAKERPPHPVEYLAHYLLQNNPDGRPDDAPEEEEGSAVPAPAPAAE